MNKAIWNLIHGNDEVMMEDISILLNEAATIKDLEERRMRKCLALEQPESAEPIQILES